MKLLQPTNIGNYTLKNSMVMAPMTRSRANIQGEMQDINVTYYQQRSTAGLIISEGINISEQATGNLFTPGLYTPSQIESWKKITKTVHDEGSFIFAQLWHTGRVGHSVDKNGVQTVSSSAIAIEGQQHFTSEGLKLYETPRALATKEVRQIVQDYEQAALNAIEAGFDGVELHAAFGYLPNQFLVDGINQRTDEYGGSIENRSRFVLEIMKALIDAIGGDKVGIKLSPSIPYNGVIDSNPTALYTYLISELNQMDIAYLQLMQPLFPLDELPHYPKDTLASFGHLFSKPIISNGGYTKETGEAAVVNNDAQLISYGTAFLSNPDLPKRFEVNADLNQADQKTLYAGGIEGYIDYPTLQNQ